MLILDNACTSSSLLKMIYFALEVSKYVFIIIPIGLIIMLSIDLLKNVMATDQEEVTKNNKTAIRRVMMAVVIFLIPTIARTAFNLLDYNSIMEDITTCVANANVEIIKEYEDAEEEIRSIKEEERLLELANKNKLTDPETGKKIVPGKNNSNNNDDNDDSRDNEIVTNANAQAYLDALEKMSDKVKKAYKTGNKWEWNWTTPHSFTYHQKHKRKTTCIGMVAIGLIEIGVLKSGQYIQPPKYGFGPRNGADSRVKKYLKLTKIKYKSSLKSLIKQKKIKPGDIIIYRGHENVYAGNGKFYDGGSQQTSGKCHGCKFKTFGPVSKDNRSDVYAIYSFKE